MLVYTSYHNLRNFMQRVPHPMVSQLVPLLVCCHDQRVGSPLRSFVWLLLSVACNNKEGAGCGQVFEGWWVARSLAREQVHRHMGDTGIMDYMLKAIANRTVGPWAVLRYCPAAPSFLAFIRLFTSFH